VRSFAFCCGLIFGCFLAPAKAFQAEKPVSKQPALYDDAAGYEVLSLVLERETRDDPHKLIRIYCLTDPNLAGAFQHQAATTSELRAAADDLEGKNKAPQKLQAKFKLSHIYKLVEYELAVDNPPPVVPLADGTLPPPSEQNLDDKISRGVFHVGAVGFNPTRTHAIAYVDWVCGTLCGQGHIYILEKDKWGWRVTGTPRAWVH
jgi:hypothetical protein